MSVETVEHYHHYIPNKGSVTIKVERNSRGMTWEIRIDKPIDHTAVSTGCDILQEIAAIEAGIATLAAQHALKPGDKVVVETGLQG